MSLKKQKTKASLKLPNVVDAYQVNDLHKDLCDALSHGKPLTIDASKVERIDTLNCQLLIAAKHCFEQADITFALKTPSEALTTALDTLGLKEGMAC